MALEYRTGSGRLFDRFRVRFRRALRPRAAFKQLVATSYCGGSIEGKLVARIPENSVRERLILNARARYPDKTETELYELVLTNFEHDRG